MSAHARISEIKREGYDIDFGDVFNQSFENYKKIALNAGVAFILLGVAMCVILFGIMAVSVGVSSFSEGMAGMNPANLSGIGSIVYIVSIVVISGLAAPINAGILKMAYQAYHNEPFSVGTTFDYYKSPYFQELFIVAALLGFLNGVMQLLMVRLGFPFIGQLANYVVSFFMLLTTPLIVFGGLKAIEAIKASAMVVSKQFLILLGLVIVALIVSCLGFIAFCIGIIFTFPFFYATVFCIYNYVIGTENEDELDQIGVPVE